MLQARIRDRLGDAERALVLRWLEEAGLSELFAPVGG
jgi:hypothetical protein